jgi:HTH-type transcriptional regulator / antitoxin HigA
MRIVVMARKTIAPIRTKADYRRALTEIETLWSAEPGTSEHDQLEVLATLIDAYESKRFPIDAPDPIEAIKFRMEQAGYERADFVAVIGSASRASEILNRRRALTTEMIWKLHTKWQIPAESLVRPYKVGQRRDRERKQA